jgi:3-dehydroquinate dehydratase-2
MATRGSLLRIAVIHGPNLRLLGTREPEVYGTDTLDDVNRRIADVAHELGVEVETFQSNHEGELLDFIADVAHRVQGILINPGAFTHTSIALRDALVGVERPFVEVHLSNTAGRERFRRHSYLSGVAAGVVYGFGVQSYLLGLRGLAAVIGRP